MKLHIIAEVGQGYEGKVEQALLLVKAASAAKANSIKFQVIFADELATEDYLHFNLFKNLEMPLESWIKIKEKAIELNIELILDIFGPLSLNLAKKLKTKTVKIHPTDLNNIPLLESIENSKDIRNVIIGIGGATLKEIKTTIDIIPSKKITLMLGFQGYPTKTENIQLSRLTQFKNLYSTQLGYADHEDPNNLNSILVCAISLGFGVEIIEKHITLSKNLKLEDYESALNSDEFECFANDIRKAFLSIGNASIDDDFAMSKQEKKYRANVRRDVVSSKRIEKGEILNNSNLTLKRTGGKNHFGDINDLMGKTLNISIERNMQIRKQNIDEEKTNSNPGMQK